MVRAKAPYLPPMAAPPLTLRAIALALDIPESTVRYHRDTFADYLPVVGNGRRRRYPFTTVPLFRTIAAAYAEGLTRDEIVELLAADGDKETPTTEPMVTYPVATPVLPRAGDGELLALVLDGERERREVMWQMAREIVRLGEAIERQHTVLGEVAGLLEQQATRSLPPARDSADAPAASAPDAAGLKDRLTHLRDELEKERQLVERLRRSKVEIEQRAAEAEAALASRERGGLFRRRVPDGGA